MARQSGAAVGLGIAPLELTLVAVEPLGRAAAPGRAEDFALPRVLGAEREAAVHGDDRELEREAAGDGSMSPARAT